MSPIAVRVPVKVTMAKALPVTTVVPENKMLIMSCLTALSSGTALVVLLTLTLSPVSRAWSIVKLADVIDRTRQSAGILSPTLTRMISPGTRS